MNIKIFHILTGIKTKTFSRNIYRYSSDEDILPDELPKQNSIKNGLRSNYYKFSTDTDSKSVRFVSMKFFFE
jgi:hypothetical protein